MPRRQRPELRRAELGLHLREPAPRHVGVDDPPATRVGDVPRHLGFGRIVVSETEAPNMLASILA